MLFAFNVGCIIGIGSTSIDSEISSCNAFLAHTPLNPPSFPELLPIYAPLSNT